MTRKKANTRDKIKNAHKVININKFREEKTQQQGKIVSLPWYVSTKDANKPKQDPLVISKEMMAEWNAAKWIKRLIAICGKIGVPVQDPLVMEHTPTGSLFMRWENGVRAVEVVVLEKDAFGTISLINTDGSETIAVMGDDDWSQGTMMSEENIERVWRWYVGEKPSTDYSFLSELISVSNNVGE